MSRKWSGLKLTRSATKEERSAYHKALRLKALADPERVAKRKAQEAAFRVRNHFILTERHRAWRADNPKRWKEIQRKNYEASREELNAKQRQNNKTPERQAFMREYLRQHRAANPELYRTYTQNRRSRWLNAGTHTTEEWLTKLADFDGRCAYCGSGDDITRDHVVPLSRGGSNEISNIVPACDHCNSSKHDLTVEEFMARRDAARA